MDDFFNIGTQSVVPWRGTDRFNIYRYVWHAIRQKQRRQQVSAGSRKPFLCNIRPFAISFVTGVFTLSAKNVVSPVVMIPLEWILNRIFLNEWTDRQQKKKWRTYHHSTDDAMWAIHILKITCRTPILIFSSIGSCFSRWPNKLSSFHFQFGIFLEATLWQIDLNSTIPRLTLSSLLRFLDVSFPTNSQYLRGTLCSHQTERRYPRSFKS